MNTLADKSIKLVCERVWKVYGAEPQRFFSSGSQDASTIHKQIVESGNIGAACDVSFEVLTGEIFVIMGLSGSGKSTVVRCLSRLVEPTSGRISLDGEDLLGKSDAELIDIRRHKMGMVFQNFGLLPHLNVLDNVAFPLKVQGLDHKARYQRATEMIELVGLQGRESSFPNQLSGGQQQRVGIARSLAVEPDVWFLDEPFSALDPLIRRQMQDEFLRLQRLLHKTIVFITHDFLEAIRVADRIAIMKDGWIEQIGSPADVIMRPGTEYVREFTREVPRSRILCARDVMSAVDDGTVGEKVAPETPIDDFMGLLGDDGRVLGVDDNGAIVGHITAMDIVRALADGGEKAQ